jgi:hypothetical protein
LINDIKAKLPSKKKVSDEDLDDIDDSSESNQDATDPGLSAGDKTGATDISNLDMSEEEDTDRPQTMIDKIKAKLIPQKKSAKSSEDGKTTPKKKINPVVLVVVLAGLAIWALYEEEPEQVAEQPKLKKMYNKPKKIPKADAETPAPTETPSETAATTEPVAEEPAVVAEPSTEPVAEEPAVVAEPSTEPVAEEPAVVAEPSTEPVAEEPAVVAEPSTGPVAEEPAVVAEPSTGPVPEEEPVVSDVPPVTSPTDVSADSVDGQVTNTDESSMTDKILEDLEKQVKKDQPKEVKKEYVTPPDYEYKGRGLVYNCAGKHWACVDGPSYKTCENNFSSTTYQKKNIECYPFNVYDTTKSCQLMQNRVVSSNAKTDFCKGN